MGSRSGKQPMRGMQPGSPNVYEHETSSGLGGYQDNYLDPNNATLAEELHRQERSQNWTPEQEENNLERASRKKGEKAKKAWPWKGQKEYDKNKRRELRAIADAPSETDDDEEKKVKKLAAKEWLLKKREACRAFRARSAQNKRPEAKLLTSRRPNETLRKTRAIADAPSQSDDDEEKKANKIIAKNWLRRKTTRDLKRQNETPEHRDQRLRKDSRRHAAKKEAAAGRSTAVEGSAWTDLPELEGEDPPSSLDSDDYDDEYMEDWVDFRGSK